MSKASLAWAARSARYQPALKNYPMLRDRDIIVKDFARVIGVRRPTLYQYIREHEADLTIDKRT